MIADGLKLMVVGMGMVFIFLCLMVMIISLAAKILAPFSGLLQEQTGTKNRRPANKKTDEKTGNAIISAIAAAVHQYRKDHEEK
jgi:oxaloacetate decarboxylase gamma subunit